jgi:hypothetical protein
MSGWEDFGPTAGLPTLGRPPAAGAVRLRGTGRGRLREEPLKVRARLRPRRREVSYGREPGERGGMFVLDSSARQGGAGGGRSPSAPPLFFRSKDRRAAVGSAEGAAC